MKTCHLMADVNQIYLGIGHFSIEHMEFYFLYFVGGLSCHQTYYWFKT